MTAGAAPIYLGRDAVAAALPPSALIDHLAAALPTLTASIQSPARSRFPIDDGNQSVLLLMPSWSLHPTLPYIGVKVVTLFPTNSALSLPSVHAFYLLFHSLTGRHLAVLDGDELTLRRTAAFSALAAKLLSRPNPETLTLVGAGALAPHLARAHLAAIPSLRKVFIWNRTPAKARGLADELTEDGVAVGVVDDVDEAVSEGEVVVCATAAGEAVVKGGKLRAGAHLGLIGSASPAMRECDDEALRRGRVFVDCPEAMEEAGELVSAVTGGVVRREEMGLLVEVMTGEREGRVSPEEITVFKSVGFAVLDLLAAQLVYEKHCSSQ